MQQRDTRKTPLLAAWVPGTRLARFMSELGFTRHGPTLAEDGTAAILRQIRAATEAELAACDVEYSRVDVFRTANERAGAVLTDLRSNAPTDETRERFLEVILYLAFQAEAVRRERECFPPSAALHASVAEFLGLELVDAQRGILCGVRTVEECFPPNEPERPGTMALQLLQEYVADTWPRHLAKLEAEHA